MKRLIFILGGARSGKSQYAVKLARSLSKKVAFIATCTNPDKEMRQRIELHKASRPADWKVFEEGKEISSVLNKIKNKYDVLIVDCLGLFISNLLSENLKEEQILKILKRLTQALSQRKSTAIFVSNDVGGGIIPVNLLARRFRDLAGMANQMFAQEADEVIFMQAGIPMRIKGEKDAKIKRDNI